MEEGIWIIRCRTRDNDGSFTLYKTFEKAKEYAGSLARNARIVAIERPDGSDGWCDIFVPNEGKA